METQRCESLCKMQDVYGCCYLDYDSGCSWRHGSKAVNYYGDIDIPTPTDAGKAVTCSISGALF